MIELHEIDYIGRGAERKCYRHPTDKTKVIKVEYISKKDRDQNRLDSIYYKHLNKKNISYTYISRFYGTVQTTQGQGVVFQYIEDYNGKVSKTLEYVISHALLDIGRIDKLLTDLHSYLERNNIIFGDVVLSNILCQKINKDTYKLIIIDGLGARRLNWKFWLQLYSTSFQKRRMNKQWQKLLFNYENTKISI